MTDNTIHDGILDQFAVAYCENVDALARFLAKYPEHTSDLIDYAHELNLVQAHKGDENRELTAEEKAWLDNEVARMSSLRESPLVLVCIECSGLCTADRTEYAAKQIAFCPCGQRALPQDEAYFERRNVAREGALP